MIKEEIDAAVRRVIRSGRLILGKEVEEFERSFALSCGCEYGIGVNSGTDALHLALRAIGVVDGDEVITVPNTSPATVSAILQAGAKTVLIDIEEASYLMDVNRLRRAITQRTKAIMPVHLFGQMAEIKPLLELADKVHLPIIEDCAQAHGASFDGKVSGSFGKMGCFSFYPTKNLGAYGDAGIIVTHDPQLAERLKMLRIYGFSKKSYSEFFGVNSRLDELQAAILSTKLRHLDAWNRKRRHLASLYIQQLSPLPITLPHELKERKHVYHLFVIRLKHRDALRQYLFDRGIMTDIHYPTPIHMQPGFRSLGYKQGDFPVSEQVQSEILSLPMFPELKEEEVREVCRHILTFFSS